MEWLCPWESARYFIFSSSVPTLLYYSHLIAILAAIIFAIALIPRVRESLPVKLFLATIFFFIIWTVIDIPLWALNRPDIDLFLWSVQVLTELFVYVSAFYFAYVFIAQKDLKFLWKIGLVALLSPIIVLLPTAYLFPGVDTSCVVSETSFVIYFTYGVEILLSFLVLFTSFWGIRTQSTRKSEIVLFTTGVIVFLVAFSSGNIIGSLNGNWDLAQVGLFGMPVFIAFLTYTVVKFKTFNVKLIATQALVVATMLLLGSLFFSPNIYVIAATFVAFSIGGIFIIQSVKREIKLREDLEISNKWKESLIHAMNHQIKGFLGVARNVFAELLGTDYGQIPEQSRPLVTHGLEEMGKGVEYVQGILNSISAQNGMLLYNMKPVDLKSLISDLVSQLKDVAEKAGLSFESIIADGDYTVSGDVTKLEEVFKNLITNAILYNNPHGDITVSLSHTDGKVLFAVKDTGMGISKDDQKRLFKPGGMGKDSIKHNANASGYGLAFVEPVIKEHQGKIWYETEVGKGTTFFVELPVNQSGTGGQAVAS